MKKNLIITLFLITAFFISWCSLDIKTNKELKEEQEIITTISWLQQKFESLNNEISLARQELSWLQLQKQINDLQAENEKLKKTTIKKTTTNNTNLNNSNAALEWILRELRIKRARELFK